MFKNLASVALTRNGSFQIFKKIFNSNNLKYSNIAVKDDLKIWKKFKSKYTKKQLQFVLDTLNNSDETGMKNHGLLESELKVVESIKNEKQVIKSLDQFITCNIANIEELQNICSTIMLRYKKKSNSIDCVSPAIKKEYISKINTVIGLRIKSDYISWTHLKLTGSNCQILQWDCQNVSNLPLNADISEIIKMASTVAKCIPKADAYILEKPPVKPFNKLNATIFKLMVRQQQILTSILSTLWANKCFKFIDESNDDTNNHNTLYTMSAILTAQKFGLYFGSEIVSSNSIMESFLESKLVGIENILSLTFNKSIKDKYNSLTNHMKDELSKSALTAITFFDSITLKQNNV